MIDSVNKSYIHIGGYFMKWFNSQPRLIQIILLLIPVVNWIVELIVRWSTFVAVKKHKVLHLVVAILVTAFGLIFGWVDLIWCLLFKHLLFAK